LIKLTALNLIATQIYCIIINDKFSSVAYDTAIAELSCLIRTNGDSMCILISGYNNKSLLLLESLLNLMKDFRIKSSAFNLAKEKLKRYYNNIKLGSPISISSQYYSELFNQIYYSIDERLSVLEDITIGDTQTIIKQEFNQFFIEALFFSNIGKDEAISMVLMVEECFNPKILINPSHFYNRNVELPNFKKFVYQGFVNNKDELNNAIRYYLQCGVTNDKNIRNRLQIIEQILKEYTFNVLRTKEQLG